MLNIPSKLRSAVCLSCYIEMYAFIGLIRYYKIRIHSAVSFSNIRSFLFIQELNNWVLGIIFQNILTSWNIIGIESCIWLYLTVKYKLKHTCYSRLVFPLHCCIDYSNGLTYFTYISQKDINYLLVAIICYHSLYPNVWIEYIHNLYNNEHFLIFFNYSSVEYFPALHKHASYSPKNFRIAVFMKLEYHMLARVRLKTYKYDTNML
jgi:hypothetical protein